MNRNRTETIVSLPFKTKKASVKVSFSHYHGLGVFGFYSVAFT